MPWKEGEIIPPHGTPLGLCSRGERLWDVAGADGKKTSGTRGNGQSLPLLRTPASCWRHGSNRKDVVGRAAYTRFLLLFFSFLILHLPKLLFTV